MGHGNGLRLGFFSSARPIVQSPRKTLIIAHMHVLVGSCLVTHNVTEDFFLNEGMESELNFEANYRAKDWTESSLEESVGEEGDQTE